MTYHDRSLLVDRKAKGKAANTKRAALTGAFSITLFPKSPRFHLGSVSDDWKAVGKDIRKAMKSQEFCE